MSDFLRDLRLGGRQLGRRPGLVAAAVASLALGVGINTTLFSIVNGVLLRGTLVSRPDRLVEIYTGVSEEFPQLTTSYPDYLDLEYAVDAFSGMAAAGHVRGIISGERPELISGEAVTAGYFDVLGIPLALGRSFDRRENLVPGAAPVAVISHGLWQRRFGGQPGIVGQELEISSVRYTIIGVAPPRFTGMVPGLPVDVWVPIMMVDRLVFSGVQTSSDKDPGTTRVDRRGTRWLFVKGRLADDRTVDQARAQVDAVFARLRRDYPLTNEKVTSSVVPAAGVRFHPVLDPYVRGASVVLMAAVGLILLIACANVANLLIAQAVARRSEFALRAALGASRARIIRQLLSEALLLAAAGGGLGVLLAWWAGRALAGLGTEVFPIPVAFDFSLDGRVLAFAACASLGTALVFGLAPAWSASRTDVMGVLKGSPEGGGRRRITTGDVLVATQLAFSVVLLVSGALLGRGLLVARHTDIGFDPTHVSSLQFNLKMNGYDVERAAALREELLRVLRALPGVVAVSTASRLPLAPDINLDSIHVPGHHRADDEGTVTDTVGVGPDYFEVVGVPVVEGRAFTDADVAASRRVAIVNETMARKYWPEASAVGRLVYTSGFESEPLEIVGVARDHKVRSVGEAPRAYLHVPDRPSQGIGLVVRTGLAAAAMLPTLRKAVWSLEPNVLFTEDVPAGDVVATTMAPTRLGAIAAGAFGGLALLLAAVGLYGIVSYAVGRRTREIGIRIAIGATRAQVIRMVLLKGGRLAAVGIALGALVAAAAGRVLESLLYGVSTYDPAAYATACGVLLLVATGASLRPAVAASSVDPVRALRSE
ncbi:MAG TPA: ABC transporter permease [Vicinamibacterales bacterium]|nr:ABC transporter permease [Vicinamibacterales bacterium]